MGNLDNINLYPEMNRQISDLLAMSEEPMYLYAAKYIKQLESDLTIKETINRLYLTTSDMDDMRIRELVEKVNRLEAELAGYREAEQDGRLVVLPDCSKCAYNGYGECYLSNCIGKLTWADEDSTDICNNFEAALREGTE